MCPKTGVLASDLDRNLAIKSPLQPAPKLTALPRHMVVAQMGSKVVRCKGNSLLTSTAMRFQSGNDGLNSILDGSPDPIPGKCIDCNIPMAGNFRGVLIFVIFVVGSAVTKITTHEI